MKAPLSKDKR
jgi:hypothetical protein